MSDVRAADLETGDRVQFKMFETRFTVASADEDAVELKNGETIPTEDMQDDLEREGGLEYLGKAEDDDE